MHHRTSLPYHLHQITGIDCIANVQMAILEHDKKQLSLERQQLKRTVQSLQVCTTNGPPAMFDFLLPHAAD